MAVHIYPKIRAIDLLRLIQESGQISLNQSVPASRDILFISAKDLCRLVLKKCYFLKFEPLSVFYLLVWKVIGLAMQKLKVESLNRSLGYLNLTKYSPDECRTCFSILWERYWEIIVELELKFSSPLFLFILHTLLIS